MSDPNIQKKYPKINFLLSHSAANLIEIGRSAEAAKDEILNLVKENETLKEKLNNKLWCAWCGKWGDHQSGWCGDLLNNKIKTLEIKIEENENYLELIRDEYKELYKKYEKAHSILDKLNIPNSDNESFYSVSHRILLLLETQKK